MTDVSWQIHPNIPGGRGIERPWITQKIADVRDSTIVDFGCMDHPHHRFSTDYYNPHPSNRIIGVDLMDVPEMYGKYLQCDICDAPIEPKSVDVALCVSVMEHLGTGAYTNNVKIANHDLKGLVRMAECLKEGGRLFVTVPAGPDLYVHAGWIRVYTPQRLMEMTAELPECESALELFRFVDGWWFECSADELTGVVHYAPGTDINAICGLTVVRRRQT